MQNANRFFFIVNSIILIKDNSLCYNEAKDISSKKDRFLCKFVKIRTFYSKECGVMIRLGVNMFTVVEKSLLPVLVGLVFWLNQ